MDLFDTTKNSVMKLLTVLFAWMFLPISGISQCTFTARITDTYGDGWNDGLVKIQVNGVDVLTNVGSTFTNGPGPIDYTFSASNGNTITVIETAAGSYETEMRVEVLNGSGTTIIAIHNPSSGGTNGVASCPGPMAYSSATAIDLALGGNIETCIPSTQAVQMTRIEVVTTGTTSPLSLTQLKVDYTGTSPMTAINKVRIYYTGTSSTFAQTNEFVLGGTNPAANMTMNGSQVLSTGTNYFWIVYTLSGSGVVGNTFGADMPNNSIVVGGTTYSPSTSPNCSCNFTSCSPYPTTSTHWIKSDVGLTSTVGILNSWSNQSTPNITGNMIPVPGITANPNVITAGINYQNFIRFDGVDDGLKSTNAFTSVSSGMYSNQNNTIYMVKNNRPGYVVDYKWETQGGAPTRIGFEVNNINGNTDGTQRFDFVGGSPGTVNIGTSSFVNKNNIVGGMTNSISSTIRLNGLFESSSNHGGLSMSTIDPTVARNLYIGCDDVAFWPTYSSVDIAEEITFNSTLNASQLSMLESYLAIKYGITLGNPANVVDYHSSTGTVVFYGESAYHNNIIGIGRDGVSTLYQKQSHNNDDTVRIYLSSLTLTNALNSGSFNVNNSYVVTGANTGKMCATAASNAEMPIVCGLYSRLEREWKVTRTNMAQNFNMDFKLAGCGAPGSVNVTDLRLLVDDDGNFANGGTTCYSNATNPGLFSYLSPTIKVTGITTAMIPDASTKYITIGSVNAATPLPVELLYFDAKPNNNRTVDLTWTTASEINSDYFIVEKSADASVWSNIGSVEAVGNSTQELNYYLEDLHPYMGINYYRLKQVDLNGSVTYSEIRAVKFGLTDNVTLFPNPVTDEFFLHGKGIGSKQIQLFNSLGQLIPTNRINQSEDMIQFDSSELSRGIYTIQIQAQNEIINLRLMKVND